MVTENKYMFVCPKCQETYSSDRDVAQKCPNCGNNLERMFIDTNEWKNFDDAQKRLYKDDILKTIKSEKNKSPYDETLRLISYIIFHFCLSGLYIARTNELPYVLLVMAISFALFWWKRPSLEEWKSNCIKRKWFYLIGGLLFGMSAIMEPTTITTNYGLYSNSFSNWGTKITYSFYAILLLCKGFCSIRYQKELNRRYAINNSTYYKQSPVIKNKPTTSMDTKKQLNANLIEFNNRIFPNNCRDHVKKQMKYLIGDSINDDDYLKIYIYCMTHYLVNHENYEYITKMLPVAHPELKDRETIKQVAAYAFMCTTGNAEKIDLTNRTTYQTLENMVDSLEDQIKIRSANSDKNKEPYDETRGLTREKPMYFAGVRNTESYLNSLMDEEGNKLHTGMRYCYNADGIPDMLDCYQMLKENGENYGELFVSIYGTDNYQYVPKGYRHPTLSKPTTYENEAAVNEPIEVQNDSLIDSEEEKLIEKPEEIIANEDCLTNDEHEETNIIVQDVSMDNEPKIENVYVVNEDPIPSSSLYIMYCRKCGTKLDPGVSFCRKCGTRIGGMAPNANQKASWGKM